MNLEEKKIDPVIEASTTPLHLPLNSPPAPEQKAGRPVSVPIRSIIRTSYTPKITFNYLGTTFKTNQQPESSFLGESRKRNNFIRGNSSVLKRWFMWERLFFLIENASFFSNFFHVRYL